MHEYSHEIKPKQTFFAFCLAADVGMLNLNQLTVMNDALNVALNDVLNDVMNELNLVDDVEIVQQ